MQYFVIKIQSCVRGYQAQCSFKKLKRESRDKKIQKNKRLSDVMSRVQMKIATNQTNIQKQQVPSTAHKENDIQRQHKPSKANQKKLQKQREKKAALTIERFFILIKAEIEMEISRLEHKSTTAKASRNGGKRKGKKNRSGHVNSFKGSSVSPSTASHFMESTSATPRTRPSSSPQRDDQSRRRGVQDGGQDLHNVRYAPSPRQRMPSIQSIHSRGNDGYNSSRVGVMQNSKQDLCNSHPHNNAMRCASPARERVPSVNQHGRYTPRNASPSRDRMPSIQSVVQHSGYTPRASPARERVPPHCGGTPASTFNQTPMHAPSPSSYDNPPHPNGYPPINLQTYSFSSRHNPPSTTSRQSAMNPMQPQGHNPPHSVSNISHHSQPHRQNPPVSSSHQSAATPIGGHYAEHQRRPAQSQTPVQKMRQHQKSYTRY